MQAMNRQQLIDCVIAALQSIAPEVQQDDLVFDQLLRDQVDLDSMDWLNFLISLHERLGVDIPESDYARLRTPNDLFDYLQARMTRQENLT
ncbi:MAG: acyl carrier protein [Janthinobacterium sp.]|jgi:acyl carrier protein